MLNSVFSKGGTMFQLAAIHSLKGPLLKKAQSMIYIRVMGADISGTSIIQPSCIASAATTPQISREGFLGIRY